MRAQRAAPLRHVALPLRSFDTLMQRNSFDPRPRHTAALLPSHPPTRLEKMLASTTSKADHECLSAVGRSTSVDRHRIENVRFRPAREEEIQKRKR